MSDRLAAGPVGRRAEAAEFSYHAVTQAVVCSMKLVAARVKAEVQECLFILLRFLCAQV